MKRVALAGILVVLLFAGLLLLLIGSGPDVPDHAEPTFDLAEVRALAGDEGPDQLRTVLVSAGIQRGFFLRVGGELGTRPLPVYPVQLAWDDGRSVLLEPSTDADCAENKLPVSAYDADAWNRMQQAMRDAQAIVVTHEHFDHLCGLTASPHFDELAPKAHMTTEQLTSDVYMSSVNPALRERATQLEFEQVHRLAPGVVLIKAPGHTPGSLWIYIRERGGTEWLLVGDTVWTEESITHARAKPWVVSVFGGEDAASQAAHIRTLIDLRASHPEVQIMVAHESKAWEDALRTNKMAPL